jgi:hypothetical protein
MQPIIRMVNRIHIVEEARHIGFARAELVRTVAELPRAELPVQRALLGRVALIVARNLINPEVYRSVGLDPAEARRAALANPAHHETLRYGGEKVVPFLREAGMIGPPATILWRRSHLLACSRHRPAPTHRSRPASTPSPSPASAASRAGRDTPSRPGHLIHPRFAR